MECFDINTMAHLMLTILSITQLLPAVIQPIWLVLSCLMFILYVLLFLDQSLCYLHYAVVYLSILRNAHERDLEQIFCINSDNST